MTDPLVRLRRFLAELKRRNVYRVAVTYGVVAFLTLQAAELLFPATTLEGLYDELVLLAFVGFPIALVLAWAFEMTPEGVRRTPELEREAAGSPETGGSGWIPALLVLAVAGAGTWYWTAGPGGEPAGREAAVEDTVGSGVGPDERSIAVLPFDNLSGTEASRPFVNGLHDDLLTRLSNISELKVISRTSVLPYRETTLSLPQIADSLGVTWIVEGGVQQVGDQVQVNAQLIRAEDDTHRWAESYRRRLTPENLFAIQSELTKRIARSLEARLTDQEESRVERAPTEDLGAYRLYVRGRNLLDQRTGESMRGAVRHFERALDQDSSFALAWSGLADAVGLLREYGYGVPEEAPRQEKAARRALSLAPDLAAAHASLSHHLMARNQGGSALRHLRRAVELQPSYAQAHHWLGWLLSPLGRLEEAMEHASLAVDLNPRHSAAGMVLAEALVAAGRPEEALAEVRRIGRMHPAYTATPMNEALALLHLGRSEEAYSVAEEGLPKARDYAPRARMLLAIAAGALGDSSGVERWITRMEEAGDSEGFLGVALAATGRTDRAYEALRGQDAWDGWATVGLRYWFPERMATFREDPRYDQLIRDLNTAWGLNPDGSLPEGSGVDPEAGADV